MKTTRSLRSARLAVFGVGLMFGCGGSGNDDGIVGTWNATINQCVAFFDVQADGTYGLGLSCPLADGRAGTDYSAGHWSTHAGQVTLAPTQSTCPDPDSGPIDYRIDGETLSLTSKTGSGQVVLTRSKSGRGVSGAIVYGCFAAGGSFRAAQLASIR